MEDIVKNLFNAQAHFGHQKRFRTPQLKDFIYKCVNKIDIINLGITANQIIEAKRFLVKNKESNVLIISNRELDIQGKFSQIKKWKPGYISNFQYGKLDNLPDIIIVDKIAYNLSLVNEAEKVGITIIGLCDTNTSNKILLKTDYKIIINDDSDKAITLLLNELISAQ